MQSVRNSADTFTLAIAEPLLSTIEIYLVGHTSEHMHIEWTIGACSAVIYRMISDNKCPHIYISTGGVFLIGNTADIAFQDIAFNLHKS